MNQNAYEIMSDVCNNVMSQIKNIGVKIEVIDVSGTVSNDGRLLPVDGEGINVRFVIYPRLQDTAQKI